MNSELPPSAPSSDGGIADQFFVDEKHKLRPNKKRTKRKKQK